MIIQLRIDDKLGSSFKEKCQKNKVSVSNHIREFIKRDLLVESVPAAEKIPTKKVVSKTPKTDAILQKVNKPAEVEIVIDKPKGTTPYDKLPFHMKQLIHNEVAYNQSH